MSIPEKLKQRAVYYTPMPANPKQGDILVSHSYPKPDVENPSGHVDTIDYYPATDLNHAIDIINHLKAQPVPPDTLYQNFGLLVWRECDPGCDLMWVHWVNPTTGGDINAYIADIDNSPRGADH